MATIKAIIKEREINQDGKVNIKIRITHKRRTKYLATGFYIKPSQFDSKNGSVKKSHENYQLLNIDLQKTILDHQRALLEVGANVMEFNVDEIARHISGDNENTIDFMINMQKYITHLKDNKKDKTSKVYQTTYNMLKIFHKKRSLEFKEINFQFLNKLETYLTKNGLSINSRAIHFRNMRAIFNRSIDEGIISLEFYPFRRFKIKKEKTIKRSLSIDQLKALKETPLKGKNLLTRDFFMLSFYLIGANLTDIYNLKEIKNGRIIYRRSKTGRIYNIKVLPQAQIIIDKYSGSNNLLIYADLYANTLNFKKALNKFLKRVAVECGINETLTTYYARHTWATIASKLGISKDIIKHALGHGIDTVTDIYIDFDLEAVDQANKKVSDSLN